MTDGGRPWDRDAYKRFGFHIHHGVKNFTQLTGLALGWAVIGLRPEILSEGQMKSDDPMAEMIRLAQEAIADGAAGIDLYRYSDDKAFAGSAAASEGLTRAQHDQKIAKAAAALRAHGIDVNILFVGH